MRKSTVQTRTRDRRGGLTFGSEVVMNRESAERLCANLGEAGRVGETQSRDRSRQLLPLLNSAAAAVGEINRTDEGNSNQDQYGGQ